MQSTPITRPDWFPAASYPFESHGLTVDGATIHYLDEGPRDGPTLLLMHGNPTWSYLYREIVLALRDRFRCVAPDLPGFGLSAAPAGYDFKPASHARRIEGFVEALDLQDVTLMVQDWGGPIGLWVAGRQPARVARLVIGNTWAWPARGDKHFERFSGLMGGALGGFLIRHFNLFVNQIIPKGCPRSGPTKEAMEAYRGPFATKDSRRPTQIFPREIIGSSDFLAEVEAGLQGLLDRPAIIVWGDMDIAFRQQELRRWQDLFPGARTLTLEGAGHYIQEEAPEEIAAAIRSFVAG
jgi:haloalkane dehalogenase